MTRLVPIAALLLALGVAPRAPAQMASLQVIDREFSKIVETVAPAVVRVGPGFSGVCISDDGYVLSDVRVADLFQSDAGVKRDGVVVAFPNKGTFRAMLVAFDADAAASLLKIDEKRLPYARPVDPGELEVGHFLLSVGNAFGTAQESDPAVTLGVLAAIHRDASGRPIRFETTAATNPGQDGGPFFDVEGQLVGLARALPDMQNLALVTPIDRLRLAFASVPGAERAFPPPRTVRPPPSRGKKLGIAFHFAAMSARPAVVTLVVEPKANPDPAVTADDAPADGQEPAPKADADKGPPPPPRREGPVSGLIVDGRGYVLAAGAAIGDDAGPIHALLADGRTLRASVHARDKKAGLVLLMLDRGDGPLLPVLEPRATDTLELGQFLIAVGAPHGPPASPDPFATVGILSATHRMDAYRDAVETDAGVNLKNMGGALVDIRGRLVGVLLEPDWRFGQNSGLGFALPASTLARILPRLMSGRDSEPAYMGVMLSDRTGGSGGVRIDDVTKDFPAARAGLKKGDVIVMLDGKPMKDRQALSDYIALEKSAGDRMTLVLEREGAKIEIEMELGRRPGS